MEGIIVGQLTTYLNDNNLLPSVQSAYRALHRLHCCTSHPIFLMLLIRLTSRTLLALLDLNAAFGCVDYAILLTRLRETYGIDVLALSWIAFFLADRTQSVSFNGSESATFDLMWGIPQGSSLRPLLFIQYTADILHINASFGIAAHCYADDIQLYIHCRD